MIGVVVSKAELESVREFFELFKTPWEPAVSGRTYRVLLRSRDGGGDVTADVQLIYGAASRMCDGQIGLTRQLLTGPGEAEWRGRALPLYSSAVTFGPARDDTILTSGGHAVDYRHREGNCLTWRVGYDLFDEVRSLLTEGQPVEHAQTPTLELHIDLMRQLLIEAGVSFVEIPPRPHGYDFACCLTHDVDFFGLRRHRCDRTLAGFVARASVGTLADLVRGRRSLGDALNNWRAVASVPLVFAGLTRDPWRPFDDYARAEEPRHSTFFLVPFKGRPGAMVNGPAPRRRAVPYQMSEIASEMSQAAGRGSELAVHGIDAWRDANSGRAELKELTDITEGDTAGIRMHWLYFSRTSPERLEAAGYAYDSTWGYNDAIGFRAGTPQVFNLPGTTQLLELPLTIMDTALFFSGRMGLACREALTRSSRIIADVRHFGGTVVTNWHDRSLAPERLWRRAYDELLRVLARDNRAWFATGSRVVDWFRWRRSIRFDAVGSAELRVTAPRRMEPGAVLRIHRPTSRGAFQDVPFDGREATCLTL